MSKILEKRLVEAFKDREYVSRQELLAFYRGFEPDLKPGTFGWRIHDLKNKNIIRPLKRGLYAISYKPDYKPEITPKLVGLAKRITDTYEDVKHCIWQTQWLNEFSRHQSGKKMTLIEIEKDFVESLYYELKDSAVNELYVNPDNKTIGFYIAESSHPVIIKKLITRSPIAELTESSESAGRPGITAPTASTRKTGPTEPAGKTVKICTPSLEKILVDLFAEPALFYYLQGPELMHIYEHAIGNYTVNFTRLFSYAKRRQKEQAIRQFITNKMHHLVKDIVA